MMLTEAELAQMTETVVEKLTNEELESLGADLGHRVSVVDAVMDMDGHEGKLSCECGWKTGIMYSCWFAGRVQAHLEQVVAERFDVDGGER